MTPTAPPPPVADPAQLLADLAAARVLSTDRGARLLAEYRQSGGHGSFLDHLLASGVLTSYQAERVSTGQAASLLLGPYLLQEPVGSGSLGTVYRAVHRGDRRRVAVKVLPLRSMWNVLQAKKQVQTLSALPPHPAVLPLSDIDTAGQVHYMAWPFVEGETFESLVRRNGPLPPSHAARLLAELIEGLALLHSRGISHGLLKPANLLLGTDGRPRLLDVGMGAILADNIAEGESLLDTISTANAAISSFDYSAPETTLDPSVRTPAADMYSLGCTLYFLLTGSPPFPDGNVVDKMLAHQTEPPPPVREKSPLVPESLAELVERLLQKAPADRPADLPAVRVSLLATDDKVGSGTVRTPPPVRPADSLLDPNAQTDPPRQSALPDINTNPEYDTTPLSVALSLLKSKLADTSRADGTPESVNFDLPDPEAPPPGLPGLIDTGPPGLLSQLADSHRHTEPAAPPTTPTDSKTRAVVTPQPAVADLQLPSVPPTKPAALIDTKLPIPQPPTQPTRVPIPAMRPTRKTAATVNSVLSALSRFANRILPGIAGALPDEVQVSVFGPPHLEPGKTVRLQVYAHTVDTYASVCTLSRALQPDSEVLAVGKVDRPVKRGEQMGLHLSVRHGGLARSLTAFTWHGKPKAEPFELQVPWEAPAGRTPAALTVGLNNVQAGRVAFDLSIRPRTG